MTSRDDLLRKVIQGSDVWLQYVSSLRLAEMRKVSEQLDQITAENEQLLEELRSALLTVEAQIKQQEESVEKQRRKARRNKSKFSLREFLCQPPLEVDSPLDGVVFCTKTGAKVLLDGLVFHRGGKEHTARTINEAKRLYEEDRSPWAGYHLHYVRDGRVSSGFAWDRPFLDEIFLLN